MLKKLSCLLMLSLLPYMAQAYGLTFRVLNGSSAIVKFNSSSWFDWGTRINQGDSRSHWYLFTPKDISFSLYNRDGSPFSLVTMSGCDLIGLPPHRGPGKPEYTFQGKSVNYPAGEVDVVLTDLPDSNYYHKRIGCSLVYQK